jgi:mannan polymerase complexes MNN9 subunit
MKPKPKNKFSTTFLAALLTGAFLWFFLLPPATPKPSTQRPFQPSRRNSGGLITRFDLRNITATSYALQNRERVLILTPIARWYDGYWENLMKLSYPRELIDLGFILPKGEEGDAALESLKVRLREVQGKNSIPGGKFNLITILRQDVEVPTSQDEKGMSIDICSFRSTCFKSSKSSALDVVRCSEFVVVDDVSTAYSLGLLA